MKSRFSARTALTWLAAALFLAFLLAGSAASGRHQRVLYGALPLALALVCAGRVWWLYGDAVFQRRDFTWRGQHYAGRPALRFAYAMRAGGAGFALLGLWVFAIWLME